MKQFKPTSPGRRGMTSVDYRRQVAQKRPEKSLSFGFRRAVGRNSAGRITTRHKGGGAKRLYRVISFGYDKREVPGKILSIEYDPNRTSFIALIQYRDGEKRYVLAGRDMREGGEILYSHDAEVRPGNAMSISRLVPGTQVYNIESKPGSGGKFVRSGGSSAEILAHEGKYTTVKLPSKEVRKILSGSWGTVGALSNEEHTYVTIGKAGRSRHKGIRPTVRGSAMNPVDHPYGGGEGRQLRGTRRPKNKWGKGTRGVKTRKPKKYSRSLILQRRK